MIHINLCFPHSVDPKCSTFTKNSFFTNVKDVYVSTGTFQKALQTFFSLIVERLCSPSAL